MTGLDLSTSSRVGLEDSQRKRTYPFSGKKRLRAGEEERRPGALSMQRRRRAGFFPFGCSLNERWAWMSRQDQRACRSSERRKCTDGDDDDGEEEGGRKEGCGGKRQGVASPSRASCRIRKTPRHNVPLSSCPPCFLRQHQSRL